MPLVIQITACAQPSLHAISHSTYVCLAATACR